MVVKEPVQKIWIERNTYRDSVTLMHLADQISKTPGVMDAAILMGTPANKERMRSAGFDDPALQDADPGDLCIGIRTGGAASMDAALNAVRDFLAGKGAYQRRSGSFRSTVRPRTLASAKRALPGADLVAISLPGDYAGKEARKALEMGLHVFLFSDNVPVNEEIELKRLARERGLLLMGPDCGTALINGFPLGFCNQLPSGPVSLVAASGTGAQEVSCLLAAKGVGVSHILGTGGRDLTEQIGGLTFEMALQTLASDENTQVIVLISKPPAEKVESRILKLVQQVQKPVVISFVGRHQGAAGGESTGSAWFADHTAHAADIAASLIQGKEAPAPLTYERFGQQHQAVLTDQIQRLQPGQRFVRGLFSGGTLADEAALLLSRYLPEVHAGEGFGPVLPLTDWESSSGNVILDLGDDRFTTGRPHPMIHPGIRMDRLEAEAMDPTAAVLLMDVVLGYNADENPAEKLVPAIEAVRRNAAKDGRHLPVVVHLCGTDDDPQDMAAQRKQFEQAGCLVFSSNVEAALAAAWIARAGG